MLTRILHTAVQIAWSNLNYTLFPVLILLGAVHVHNGDGNWGWPLIVVGALPVLSYWGLFLIPPLLDQVVDAAHIAGGPQPTGLHYLFSFLYVVLFYGIVVLALPGQVLLLISGCVGKDDPALNIQLSDLHTTVCDVFFWPSWFY
jgi:hypothetical protein